MNVVIFDTETISVDKPFCYNVGYCIFDTEKEEVITEHDFVIEQVWHNPMLFSTAYYAEKKPLYISAMRGKKTHMEKWGYVTQFMAREFKALQVVAGYAYNSGFDEKVFDYNCEWFKTINPFDNIPVFDIRGYVHNKIAFKKDYQGFLERYNLFTDSGNYSTTAENVYRYLTNNPEFNEEHTALSDSQIELSILQHTIHRGCKYNFNYKVYNSIPRKLPKVLEVKDTQGEKHYFDYIKLTDYKEKNGKKKIILRG